MRRYGLTAVMAIVLSGCAVGPNYKRPVVAVPDQFRGAAATDPSLPSIADKKWFDLFGDPTVRQLVEIALQKNFDLQIAAERVQEAHMQADIQRANLFPLLSGQAEWTASKSSTIGSFPFPAGTDVKVSYTQVGLGASWELDLWGRLRRLSEAARAQYFAAEENRLAVRVSLVGEVMNAYFILREEDLELEIARKTRDTVADGLRLIQLRRDRGAANGLDVYQAEQLLYTATAQIAATERAIGQAENALNLLLGQAPAFIMRGVPLEQIAGPTDLPPGLPSLLLARRPDIRQAEQELISANAQIGAARALYFPQISLTAFMGAQSRALSDLFTAPARTATVAPLANLTLPIFQGKQLRSNVRLTEAQQRETLIGYQKTIYGALRDVSDALISHERTKEQRSQQELLVNALTESTRLSQLRYAGGLDSFLQVLDARRNLFQNELVLAQLRLLELQSIVRLYRSLGGGWQ